ncbi:succinylglutamate desuccinylase [Litoribrevibacter albus]|uniref:Succinylglutamate desuccinylase n=1 Tax=Litoribrevibacter albus TaxID=1473156 RepID=A0AA37SEX0_9GAMM|nr:succinylglutamate desuccinylase [Litoribrevibacter albus]GLQ33363.1 succinylglutamate desuccinylase [Litoribrevibacter albus]
MTEPNTTGSDTTKPGSSIENDHPASHSEQVNEMTQAFFAPNQDFLAETLNDLTPPPPANQTILDDGTRVTRLGLGALSFEPKTRIDDRILIFSSAIHGNETAPIEVCNHIINDVFSGKVQIKRPTLFLLGNPPAMRIGERFVEENLNRLFLGKHAQKGKAQNLETARAKELESWVEQFLNAHTLDQPTHSTDESSAPNILHYDLHTAIRGSHREKFALYPYVPNRQPPRQQIAFMCAADVHTVLLQATPAGTFSALTSVKYGAESFTIELGSVKPFGKNELSRYQGIHSLICLLLEGRESCIEEEQAQSVDLFEVCHEIINTGDSFELNIAEDVWNFTPFETDSVIWKDDQQEYRVGKDTQYIVFPNSKVPAGQRAGLMLKKQA